MTEERQAKLDNPDLENEEVNSGVFSKQFSKYFRDGVATEKNALKWLTFAPAEKITVQLIVHTF